LDEGLCNFISAFTLVKGNADLSFRVRLGSEEYPVDFEEKPVCLG